MDFKSPFLIVGFFLILMLGPKEDIKAQGFYDLYTVQKIEINFPYTNWDYRMDTSKLGSGNYLMGSVTLNGVLYDSIGVKYKGNSSYDSTYEKNPLHIELNTFKDQHYQGYTDIKLSNGYGDPSLIREALAYHMLSSYMDCPKANFAAVYVNGNFLGLYTSAESISNNFCGRKFQSEDGTFVKGNPMITPGPAVKSNLKYLGEDTLSYMDYYEMLSSTGWKDLKNLCLALSATNPSIDTILDVDKTLWMLAFNNALVNLDSYTGVFAQNYYLYKNNNGVFKPIIWDLNMCFGGFPYAGSPNNGMGSLSVTNMQQFSALYHSTHSDWPMILNLLSDATLKRKYLAHMRSIVVDYLSNGKYLTLADSLQKLIEPYVVADSGLFFTYAQFKGSLTTNYTSGSYSVPGLKNLCDSRATYLLSTAEFTATAPSISNVNVSIAKPKDGEQVYLSAQFTNANQGWLYYRFNRIEEFQYVLMLDDGAHGDGAANDGVFGAGIKMKGQNASYYFYAENASAGAFLPTNASHVFYELGETKSVLAKGSIVINEFVCDNNKEDINEYGLYTDWVELYNKGNEEQNLFGTYLSDKTGIPNLFEFPAGTTLKPGEYLIVWADKLPSTSRYLHSNFNLSAANGGLYLVNQAGVYLDSVVYGVQAENISLGRCPNGTGSFTQIPRATFKESNHYFCISAVDEKLGINNQWRIFPNPANNMVYIDIPNLKVTEVCLFNQQGNLVLKNPVFSNNFELNTSQIPTGLYFVRLIGPQFTETKKIIILNNHE
jgi:hypothetical protein